MRFRSYFLSAFLFYLGQLWAQNPLPENKSENLFLNMKLGPSAQEIEAKNIKFIKDRIQKYIGDANTGPGYNSSPGPFNEQRAREFLDCLKSAVTSDVFKSLNCREDWNAMMRGDIEGLRRRGLSLPDDFAQKLKNEVKEMDQSLQGYQQEEKVVVMDDVMVFEEVGPEVLMNLQAIDPNIKELGLNIKEIVLNISRSSDAVGAIKGQKGQAVPDELFVLGEMLELVAGTNCEKEEHFIANNGLGMDLLKDLAVKGDLDKKKKKETGNYILGIEEEKNPKDMLSYRFVENGTTYYLYPAKKNAYEETWVMGILSPEGQLQFRYFKLQNVQDNKTALTTQGDVSIVKANMQQGRATLKNENRFYFQAQEGLVLRADEVTAPIVGKAVIPEAKLIIGRVHMAYLTKNAIHQTDVTLRNDDVVVSTESRPINSNWSVGGQVKVSPLNGKWTMNSNVRVQNFLVGYGQNSSGESSANVSYILSRNFMSVQADSEKTTKMSLGRQFKGGKGYVLAETNFSSVHEVKLVLFIK